ncbi:cysteine/serine-rich nuclear protein 2 isoform X2 [Triplophysa rosa]|uniref:Cysteine/serine-rich nuclear protein 2 n=2 Tax=Triplophysa rosa TaxID=992332 RepID=A0A9W7T9L7_TRIRA|nr:cysteine/serine-rich nuclear protein 2 isoform X2 [Triplophysa rosa]KAI7794338.1 putative cysteine/serine-rich nuclear protein 2 [Triplophysa rosa]
METLLSRGLKRNFEDVDSGSPCSTPKDSDDDISSSDSADSCDSLNAPSSSLAPPSILRRHKASLGRKQVRFDAVTVYYFSRKQGFTSVPSQGGSSLGMARHHCAIRHYTLGEFAREQESSHKLVLHQHLRQEKLNARKLKLTRNGTVDSPEAELLTLDDISDEDLDVESVEVDDCFFLQPLPTKRRRALLRASGIARIDTREKAELRTIRLSREECGCDCRFYCDPRHCGCSQAGIKCQVDRMSFPCGCTRDGCGNTAGRIEFNPLRVRTHYLHTIMKLDLEKRSMLGVRSGEDCVEEAELVSSPSLSLSPLESDVEVETQSIQELQEEQCDSLESENETAVLHLQSAEELERRREQEEQQVEEAQTADPTLCLLQGALTDQASMEDMEGVEGVLLEGPFPEGATLVCITENHADDQRLLKDPASVLYYQVGHLETAAFETLPAQVEVVSDAGDLEVESGRQKQETCGQDSAKSLSAEVPPPPESNPNGGEEQLCPELASNGEECLETCLALDEKAVQLPPEV